MPSVGARVQELFVQPHPNNDRREFVLGSVNEEYAGSRAVFWFYCLDSLGHAIAKELIAAWCDELERKQAAQKDQ